MRKKATLSVAVFCKSRKMKLCTQLHENFQNSRQCIFSRDKQKHDPLNPHTGILPCKGELFHFTSFQTSQARVKQILLLSNHGKGVHWLWDLADVPDSPWGYYCFPHLCMLCADTLVHTNLSASRTWRKLKLHLLFTVLICWFLVSRKFLQPMGPLWLFAWTV